MIIDTRCGNDSSEFDPPISTRAEAVATYLKCLAAHNAALAEWKKSTRTLEPVTVDWRVTNAALKASIVALNNTPLPKRTETVCSDCKESGYKKKEPPCSPSP